MSQPLRALERRGVISPLDRHFASTTAALVGETRPEVLLGAALASRAVQRGHVCLDLVRLHAVGLLDADDQPVTDVPLPAPESWCASLAASPLVGAGDVGTPLVLEPPGRLYLYRYARYQRLLTDALRGRAAAVEPTDATALRSSMARLFPESGVDLQRRAAAIAVQRRFAVISGGPGTGKTSTVVRILALLQEQAAAQGLEPRRILLLAPTGKAAQRLGESIAEQRAKLDLAPAIADSIPAVGSTIHRALVYLPYRPTRFRHDAADPLPADVVLVDEASMVDLALMAKLVVAVPPDARLILLGDRDQLASVEAGAIFGDVCGLGAGDGYSAAFAAATARQTGEALPVSATRPAPGIHDCIVHLEKSYRYDAASAIGGLARAINAGDADAALAVLRDDDAAVVFHEHRDPEGTREALRAVVAAGFADLATGEPAEMLARLARFRVLCAHRRGPLGAEDLNATVEEMLAQAGVLRVDGEWYVGRPIMILRNDYQLDLFNGDVGVIAAEANGQRRAFFAGDGGELRSFTPARLPVHTTVYATTVHKSQGSEFDHVALVLPERPSPITTRELVYTGVTRARARVSLFGVEPVLRAAIGLAIERASGLRAQLWDVAPD